MNLFSQSKLTLKLKKQNNSSSTDLTNKYQKSDIIDSLKPEFLSNSSVLSENDSFVEVLHTAQSNEEKIPPSQSVFKTPVCDQNTCDIVIENKQCPVCLQTVDKKNFIIHVKTCGTSHNLSSKVLIKAVDLQERQRAEREALGLPTSIKSLDAKKKKKCKVNKQTKLKVGSDSNLDLAIAMSVSLQESKNALIIKESETLLEAGLEKEALEKRKTLENFGFISNQPVKSKSKNFSKTNSLLFKQTKEDREKRITEKVAMILIDADTDASSSELLVNHGQNTKLVSKYLNSIRNVDSKLWKKSLLEEENVSEFYVKQLAKFMKSNENNHIVSSKNDFKFSTHQNTLKHELNMNNEEFVDKLPTVVDNSNIDNIFTTSHNNIIGNKTILKFSSKWKSMLGNQFMSDLTIFAKDEHEIPAHTLVFYVQCPDILDDVITEESDACKSKKMLMWLDYSYEACLAFLELIYSGQESIIKSEFREDYLLLGTRYNILMAINSDEKHGWFSKDVDKISKRKKSYDYPYDCKRYKASSPDMFMSDDETSSSANFLGTTVNDEKSLSVLKTKQWLYSQQHKSSFTENLVINIPPQTNIPEKSPSHSFHSATTVSLKFTSSSNSDSENNDLQIKSSSDINISLPKPLTDESSINGISSMKNIKNVADALVIPVPEISKLTKSSYKEPELIIINSDSETESIDMIFCNDIKKSVHNNTFLSQTSIKKEKKNCSFNSSNVKFGNCINTIELNDNSLDSIHSDYTNKQYQRNYNSKSSHPLFDEQILNLKDKTINIDDGINVLSTVTNVLPINNVSTQIFSSNNNVIDLIEDSSDSISTIDMTLRSNNSMISVPTTLNNSQQNGLSCSKSFSNVVSSKEIISVSQSDSTTKYETNNLKLNLSPLKSNLLSSSSFSKSSDNYVISSNKEINDLFDLNSSSGGISPKSKDYSKSPKQSSFQLDNVSSTFSNTSYLKTNNVEGNVKSIDGVFSNQNVIEKCNSDSKLTNILVTSLILSNNNYDDACINTKEVDLTFLPSSECINKHLNNITSSQDEPNQLPEVTISNENEHELNKSNIEHIIDDPWMDYNDWQPVNFSPQYVSPVLSKYTSMVLEEESEVQTPRKKNLDDMQTHSSYSNNTNFSKKNSLTPNKYCCKMSTPKSLRRVQSESVIGSKQQITPLPDYSSMKTPDLRKEFDRYGLKDLGRRKGKLILRHIYNVLHPLYPSEEDNCNTEFEQYSSSSDISEHGIPDYEDGSYDEIETFNSTNLSNKISVDAGFKQLLRINEDLHKKILCYEPIWIEELKEDLKQYNVNISMQKLMTFLDDKCVTFRSKTLNDQRQKTLSKKSSKRKKLF